MFGCMDCKNAIFDVKLGEYKCKVRKTHVEPAANLRCKDWVLGKPSDSKRDDRRNK